MRSAEGINLTSPGTSAGDRRLFSAWVGRPGHQAKPGHPGRRRGLLKAGDRGPVRALCTSWAGRLPVDGRPRAGVRLAQPLREAQAASGTHEESRGELKERVTS